jgi:hypothetical protein
MFGTLLSNLKNQHGNDQIITKRRSPRRTSDKCISVINGRTYPVENWSLGGLLIAADSRPFAVDNQIDVTMRFKLRNDIVDVPHKARVVRKARDRVAFEFLPLTEQINKSFQNVIDDFVAGQFADSQLS